MNYGITAVFTRTKVGLSFNVLLLIAIKLFKEALNDKGATSQDSCSITDRVEKVSIEMIDGLPVIVPFGLKDVLLKNISRTVEAWVNVNNLKNKVPFYHLKTEVDDKPALLRLHVNPVADLIAHL